MGNMTEPVTRAMPTRHEYMSEHNKIYRFKSSAIKFAGNRIANDGERKKSGWLNTAWYVENSRIKKPANNGICRLEIEKKATNSRID